MCILSIVRDQNGFIFTHNRDEYVGRKSTPTLISQNINGIEATYPMDLQSQGTWVLTSPLWTTAILNGSDRPHEHTPPYKHSRGAFPLMLVAYDNVIDYCAHLELNGIEPFTQIILNNHNLECHKLSWDGENKNFEPIHENLFVISSSTLYPTNEKENHKAIFNALTQINAATLSDLHYQLKWTDKSTHSYVKTTSIVQIIQNVEEKYMNFKNL